MGRTTELAVVSLSPHQHLQRGFTVKPAPTTGASARGFGLAGGGFPEAALAALGAAAAGDGAALL
jgi:hypothetical protein